MSTNEMTPPARVYMKDDDDFQGDEKARIDHNVQQWVESAPDEMPYYVGAEVNIRRENFHFEDDAKFEEHLAATVDLVAHSIRAMRNALFHRFISNPKGQA